MTENEEIRKPCPNCEGRLHVTLRTAERVWSKCDKCETEFHTRNTAFDKRANAEGVRL